MMIRCALQKEIGHGTDQNQHMALRLERSRSWIMKQALSAWIDQEEERSRLTREALADVDAGRVIDHQAVQAWADRGSKPNPSKFPANLDSMRHSRARR
ncbi:MAG: ribbon-helix-helix protein, CopG family [Acidithiobacillus sp.]|nr:ribbon-helix-helix protein, CopG family [Acidithiobacillus sp.]